MTRARRGGLAIEGRLRVVLDTDTVSDQDERAGYLIALLRQPSLDVYRYSDNGPPAEAVRHDKHARRSYGVGWLFYEPPTSQTYDDAGLVSFSTDAGWGSRGLMGGDYPTVMTQHLAEHAGVTPAEASRDVTALLAAAAAGDLLITGRTTLLDPPAQPYWPTGCQVASVDDALMVIGFWLRAKGVYVMWASGTGTATAYRHAFYITIVRELLPSSGRWSGICTQSNIEPLHDLALSLYRRLVTAVKDRDRAHTASFFMHEDAARDEVLECVDSVAIHLVAALDIAARVAARALELRTPQHQIGWLRRDWSKSAGEQAPALSRVLSEQRSVLMVAASLRNTIHERAPHVATIQTPAPGDADFYIALNGVEGDVRFAAAVADTGGWAAWGIREIVPGRLWGSPFPLIERLITRVTDVLTQLLDATPMEQLLPPGTVLRERARDEFWQGEEARRSVCWQIGGGIGERAEELMDASAEIPADEEGWPQQS